MKNCIVIDDGTQELVLQNQFGEEICKVHIRTGDPSIIDRLEKVRDDIPEIMEPLAGIDLSADGSTGAENWQLLKETERELLGRLCEVFDSDEIAAVFEKRFMFARVKGGFFVTNVLNALIQLIAETVASDPEEEKARAEKSAKLNRYLHSERTSS